VTAASRVRQSIRRGGRLQAKPPRVRGDYSDEALRRGSDFGPRVALSAGSDTIDGSSPGVPFPGE